VDLQVEEGEILSVIGPNGSGKTTMFNCITGVYRPDQGRIRFRENNLLGVAPDSIARRGVARTFQNLRLFMHMTALDNLLLGRHTRFRKNPLHAVLRLRSEEIRHRKVVEEIIDFLDLQPYRQSRVSDCPYGVQKRIEIGRALAMEPHLLLLDEPISGLTSEEKEETAYRINEIRGRYKTAILLVEHDGPYDGPGLRQKDCRGKPGWSPADPRGDQSLSGRRLKGQCGMGNSACDELSRVECGIKN
jgi:branched-chain amino acid transport system ATP-binding protein